MRLPTKKELGGRLARYPLLRLLLFEVWFRLALLGFVLLLVGLALLLSRVWRVTPPGFRPVVRLSGLDWFQARSLKQTARQAEAQGRIEEALFAWQTATTIHPADPELFRGYLRTLLRSQRLPPDSGPALAQTGWLLRLTSTNQADLELVACVYEKLGLDAWVLGLLNAPTGVWGPSLEAHRLKAWFNTGHPPPFADDRGRLPVDPELELYRAAWSAGWGRGEAAEAGQLKLETALNDPTRCVVAARLQLRVATHLGDLGGYERAFHRLQARQADTVPDHIAYWRLLADRDRKAEARRLAANYSRPPRTAIETARLVEALVQFGLSPKAREVCEQYETRLFPAEPIWLAHADLLIADQQWADARALALQMRLRSNLGGSLVGYSYFLEGDADLAEDRRASAEAAFRQCVASEFTNPALGCCVAADLDRLGCPSFARDLLLKLQPPLVEDPAYWHLLFTVGWELKQADLVLSAATAAHRLQPADATAMSNYAAALLLCDRQPEQALAVTLQLMSQDPDSAVVRVNHSLALSRNRRAAEADALLRTIDPRSLTGVAATMYAWAGFEACVQLHKYDEAAQCARQIKPEFLFPVQSQRLEQERQQLRWRGAAAL